MIEQQNQGPGNGLFNIAQRILTIVVGMVETRLRLAVVELEEEKSNIIQMLMMAGITLLFAAFGLMSLLVLVGHRSAVPPDGDRHHYRHPAIAGDRRRGGDLGQSA